MKSIKSRNPQDATLRNVRAARAAIAELKTRIRQLERAIAKVNAISPSLQIRGLIHTVSRLQTETDRNTRALRFLYETSNLTQMRRQKGRKR